jgi:hypothetical protein
MSFVEWICSIPVSEFCRITGAPLSTVYSWRNAERTPPEWLQPIIRGYVDALRDVEKKVA